jgi:periplasmic mercuric ion binding protein
MKHSVVFLVALVLTTLLPLSSQAQTRKGEKVTTFDVSLHCDACVHKVKTNIAYEKGVRDLDISLEKKQVTVTYRENRNNPVELIKAFEKLGFKASVSDAEKKEKAEKKE